jgi:hypothetical protein
VDKTWAGTAQDLQLYTVEAMIEKAIWLCGALHGSNPLKGKILGERCRNSGGRAVVPKWRLLSCIISTVHIQ